MSETLNTFGEFINKFGLSILISCITIIVVLKIVQSRIEESKQRSNIDIEKAELELELTKQEKNAEMKRNEQMFVMVTEVQTKQIEQLNNISNVLTTATRDLHSDGMELKEARQDIREIYQLLEKVYRCSEDNINISEQNKEVLDKLYEAVELYKELNVNKKGDE